MYIVLGLVGLSVAVECGINEAVIKETTTDHFGHVVIIHWFDTERGRLKNINTKTDSFLSLSQIYSKLFMYILKSTTTRLRVSVSRRHSSRHKIIVIEDSGSNRNE